MRHFGNLKLKQVVATLLSLLILVPWPALAQCIIPAQTAVVKTTSYTALAADTGKMIVMNCASACTLTLPSTPQSPNWFIWAVSIGAGAATVSPNGLNLNGGSASLVLPQTLGVGITITTDNSNYFANSISPASFYGTGGGTAQAQTVSIVPAPTALYTGMFVAWLPAAANTATAPTLADSGLTAKSITKYGTAALVANDLNTTTIAYAVYDGTEFQLLNPQTERALGTSGQVKVSQGASTASTYIDFPDVKVIPAAGCNGVSSTTVAGTGWSIGSGGTATCRQGTNNIGGYIAITDTAATFAQFNVVIPQDWDSGTNPYIRFDLAYPGADGASAHTIIPQIKVSCAKGDGTTSDDVTFNAAHSSSTITLSSATTNLFFSTSNVQLNSTDMTGCVAGSMMVIQVGRATDTATSAANFYAATMTFPRLIVVQAN
jgi:hypothetical protein